MKWVANKSGSRIRWSVGVLGALGLSMAASVACSGLGAGQCETEADCLNLGFEGYTCGSDKVCVRKSGPGAEDGGNTPGCETNEQCTTLNGGRPAVCPNPGPAGKCLQLGTEHCSVKGDWGSNDRIVVANLYRNESVVSNVAAESVANFRAGDLAWAEMDALLGGVAVVDANQKRRPIVSLSCELGSGSATSADIVRGLYAAGAVEIDVISDSDTKAVAQIADEMQKPVMSVCSNCQSDARAALPGSAEAPFLFQYGTPLRAISAAFWEKAVQVGKTKAALPKIAVVHQLEAAYAGTADDVIAGIGSQGATLRVPTGANGELTASSVAALQAFAPHVVVALGRQEVGRLVVPLVESTGLRPNYVISIDGQIGMVDTIGLNEDLRLRLRHVATPYSHVKPEVAAFTQAYASRFGEAFKDFLGYELNYKRTIALGRAVRTAGPITADTVRSGWVNASDSQAPEFVVGSGTLVPALTAATTSNVNVVGYVIGMKATLAGSYFPAENAPVQCFKRAIQNGFPVMVPTPTGEVYVTGTQSLSGTDSCQ